MSKSRVGPFALLAKLGPKLLSVLGKLVKVLKGGKVLMAGASFAAYAVLFSWKFALVLIASLIVHEYGHLWAMKRYKMKTKGIYLIPLLGAAAVSEDAFPSRKAEVVIALMGPLWGFGLALATFGVYLVTSNPLAAALAGWMGMINLFNLLPINPLDGGRVMKSIAYSVSSRLGLMFLIIGLIGCFALAWKFNFGLILFLLVIGSLELVMEIMEMRRQRDRQRITAILAKALGTKAEKNAVLDAIPASGSVRLGLMIDAARERREYKRLLSDERYHVTSVADLHIDDEADVRSTPFGKFLLGSSKPTMTPAETGLSFLAYAGLAVALVALMYAVSHIPAAGAAMSLFIT